MVRIGLKLVSWRIAMAICVMLLALGNVAFSQEDPAASTKAAEPAPAETDDADKEGATDPEPKDSLFPDRVKAPDGILDGSDEWLNTARPISLRDLRGKVVLLDFWTYCCINCIHVLPDLKHFEEKYPNQLVVIGVHSAKFDNEKLSQNIREAVMRYEIEHPVVNDNEMRIWNRFGVRSWPTLTVIDPEGYFLGSQPGEGNRELIDGILDRVIKHHREKGTLDETPVEFQLERESAKPSPLRYPGKVLADPAGDRLFIADSNHNRIVITSLDGELKDVIGIGGPGMSDGSYSEAMFNHPQGMTLGDANILYVADTENHAIRAVNLTTKRVMSLAGIGEQARVRISRGTVDSIKLNSPWALQLLGDELFVAMAGPHQLWSHKIGSDIIGVYAGSGREDIINGSLAEAALAQPSGLTTDGTSLFVVDSEGSAVRKITLGEDGLVSTLAGASDLPRGRALFEFGDKDGIGGDARLQHPLGIAWYDGTLFVADSYNHKIRQVDSESGETLAWMGTGEPGTSLDPPQFSEPGGVSVAGDLLFIADTNNHRVCVANIADQSLSELEIDGLKPPKSQAAGKQNIARNGKSILLEPHTVAVGEQAHIDVQLHVPDDYKINELTPILWKLTAVDAQSDLVAKDNLGERLEAKLTGEKSVRLSLPLAGSSGKASYELSVSYGYCRGGTGGLCKMRTVRWTLPLSVALDEKSGSFELSVPAK